MSDILIPCPRCGAFYLHAEEVRACAKQNTDKLIKVGQAVRLNLPNVVGLDQTSGQVRDVLGSVPYKRNPENLRDKRDVRGFKLIVYSFKAKRDVEVFFDQVEMVNLDQVEVPSQGFEGTCSDVQIEIDVDAMKRDDARRGRSRDDEEDYG